MKVDKQFVSLLAVALLIGVLYGAMRTKPTEEHPDTSPHQAPVAELSIYNWENLAEAVSALNPIFSDEIGNISPGAARLAVWGAKRLKWDELQQLPQTKVALVMKDSDKERGKRICTSGSIIEISAEDLKGEKLYAGGMYGDGWKIYRFIAVGSTGELVERSRARFCGVVIGRFDYPNSAGGTAHSVQLVGMFDLPENKKPPTAPI
jgi:hypothetical protein